MSDLSDILGTPNNDDEPNNPTNNGVPNNAIANLQAIVEEERRKRVHAEQMQQALIEEFKSCDDFEDVRQKFREKIREFAPAALINIMELANNADSESVRANLNKWVLDWSMSDKIDGSSGELNNLLKGLRKKDPDTTSTE